MGCDTQSLGLEAYKYWTNDAYMQRAGAGVGVNAAPDAPSASALMATTEATQADMPDTESVLFHDAPLASEGARSGSCVCVFALSCPSHCTVGTTLVSEAQPWVWRRCQGPSN